MNKKIFIIISIIIVLYLILYYFIVAYDKKDVHGTNEIEQNGKKNNTTESIYTYNYFEKKKISMEKRAKENGIELPFFPAYRYMKSLLTLVQEKGYNYNNMILGELFNTEFSKIQHIIKERAPKTLNLENKYKNNDIEYINNYISSRLDANPNDIVGLLLQHDLLIDNQKYIERYNLCVKIINALDDYKCDKVDKRLLLFYPVMVYEMSCGYKTDVEIAQMENMVLSLGCGFILCLLEVYGCF